MGFGASILVWLAIGIAPGNFASGSDTVARQRVDLIELNHFIDQEGREVFRQVLFYDWSPRHRRYVVRAWRLVKSESLVPRRRWSPPCYECVWHDDGMLREVTASSFRETWTQHDPERANRLLVAEDQRVPLLQPPQPKPTTVR
jgi:hypothetical protein